MLEIATNCAVATLGAFVLGCFVLGAGALLLGLLLREEPDPVADFFVED